MLWIESVPSLRYQVRKTDVEDVGAHRAEDADHRHRQPVGPGDVALGGELQVDRDHEGDAAEHHGDLRDEAVDEEVRGRLAHPGRQRLDDPEVGGDFGDLRVERPGSVWSGVHRSAAG
jgi:hypothetical protein